MQISLETLFNSRTGLTLGLALCSLPPGIGYPAARWVGHWLSARKHNLSVRAVRSNQWVIHSGNISAVELDKLVTGTFQSTAVSLYEFWHYFRDPQAIKNMVEFHPGFIACFERARQAKTGLLLVVPHISNFDLIGRSTVLNGYPLHVLSYPNPSGMYQGQNQLRELPGLTVTPMAIEALRLASETLRSGGTVLTGIDRPLPNPDGKYMPRFFGKPAAMPVFHIRLALKHKLPLFVVGGVRKPDGRYFVWASDPVEMVPHPDLLQETVQNAEAVLEVAAGFIRQAQEQWAMFFPVWPEAMQHMPP